MRALISHRNIRRLWRGIGVACALVTAIAAADGASRGRFAVWAIGFSDGYVMVEHQAHVIHVIADDVVRGVVQVRGGSRLVITTHAPSGYTVDFHSRGALFQAVQIDGIGRAVEFGPTGGTVVQREAEWRTKRPLFRQRNATVAEASRAVAQPPSSVLRVVAENRGETALSVPSVWS